MGVFTLFTLFTLDLDGKKIKLKNLWESAYSVNSRRFYSKFFCYNTFQWPHAGRAAVAE